MFQTIDVDEVRDKLNEVKPSASPAQGAQQELARQRLDDMYQALYSTESSQASIARNHLADAKASILLQIAITSMILDNKDQEDVPDFLPAHVSSAVRRYHQATERYTRLMPKADAQRNMHPKDLTALSKVDERTKTAALLELRPIYTRLARIVKHHAPRRLHQNIVQYIDLDLRCRKVVQDYYKAHPSHRPASTPDGVHEEYYEFLLQLQNILDRSEFAKDSPTSITKQAETKPLVVEILRRTKVTSSAETSKPPSSTASEESSISGSLHTLQRKQRRARTRQRIQQTVSTESSSSTTTTSSVPSTPETPATPITPITTIPTIATKLDSSALRGEIKDLTKTYELAGDEFAGLLVEIARSHWSLGNGILPRPKLRDGTPTARVHSHKLYRKLADAACAATGNKHYWNAMMSALGKEIAGRKKASEWYYAHPEYPRRSRGTGHDKFCEFLVEIQGVLQKEDGNSEKGGKKRGSLI